jgi:hypothetical protein
LQTMTVSAKPTQSRTAAALGNRKKFSVQLEITLYSGRENSKFPLNIENCRGGGLPVFFGIGKSLFPHPQFFKFL